LKLPGTVLGFAGLTLDETFSPGTAHVGHVLGEQGVILYVICEERFPFFFFVSMLVVVLRT
jgi:hypothetical protein